MKLLRERLPDRASEFDQFMITENLLDL
jgi:hypothetical protein